MPIPAEIKKSFSAARILGNGDDRVTLSENELFCLLSQCCRDLGLASAVSKLPALEPVLASCLGGEAVGSKNSPVKRLNERGEPTGEGRQIDCYDGESQLAYEFKLRVTIAASGQGRFGEELSFPREARAAGLTPVLIVLDPTPSPRLDELIAAFKANGGKFYVGADAWAHMDSKAGKTMAVFLERYIRPPLTEMAKLEDACPETVQLSWTKDEIRVQGTKANIRIPRKS